MKLLIVTLCVLAALIPAALSIDCYVCINSDGNCETGKVTCPSSMLVTSDTCYKTVTGDSVVKGCATKSGCSLLQEACNSAGNCKTYCCDSDACNGGVPLKPVTFLALVAMSLGVAKYLM